MSSSNNSNDNLQFIMNGIAIVISLFALILSLVSVLQVRKGLEYSKISNSYAEKANNYSRASNQSAEKANNLAAAANELSLESFNISSTAISLAETQHVSSLGASIEQGYYIAETSNFSGSNDLNFLQATGLTVRVVDSAVLDYLKTESAETGQPSYLFLLLENRGPGIIHGVEIKINTKLSPLGQMLQTQYREDKYFEIDESELDKQLNPKEFFAILIDVSQPTYKAWNFSQITITGTYRTQLGQKVLKEFKFNTNSLPPKYKGYTGGTGGYPIGTLPPPSNVTKTPEPELYYPLPSIEEYFKFLP